MTVAAPLPRPDLATYATPTLDEARRQIATWTDLPLQKRRNFAATLSGVARICDLPEAMIPLDCRALNQRLFAASPAAREISGPRFTRVCSDLRGILRRMGLHAPELPGAAGLTAPWRDLHAALAPYRGMALIGFLGFCSQSGLEPASVTPDSLTDYETFLMTQVLCPDPATRARQTASNWNWARRTIEGWPAVELSRPAMRQQYTLPLDRYPEAFQADVRLFAARLAGDDDAELFADDVVDPDVPRRNRGPLRPRTIAGRLDQIRRAAAALVLQGTPIEELKSLRDLVEPIERAQLIRRFYRDRHGKEPNSQVCGILEVLRQIARFHCRLPKSHVDRITRWAATARPQWQLGMTEKNRQRLRGLIQEKPRAMLQHFPEELLRRARSSGQPTPAGARLVAYAVALEILLTFPMRRANLAGLRLDQHLQWLNGPRKPVSHIFLSSSETKNREGIQWPLAEPTARLIETYLTDYRPLLAGPANRFLFPGPDLKGRSAHELAIGLSTLINQELGLTLNIHLLRHFAAWTYLNRCPGAYEIVRQVLGHKDIRVTIACYTGLEADAAARHFDAVVLQDREASRPLAQAAYRRKTPKKKRVG